MNDCTLVFNKARCKQIAKLRAEGNDPFPGYTIIESPTLLAIQQQKRHPFLVFIKGRTA